MTHRFSVGLLSRAWNLREAERPHPPGVFATNFDSGTISMVVEAVG